MKYEIERTSQFKKDYKLAKKQGKNLEALKAIVKMLENDVILPESCHDHPLKQKHFACRELYWLLCLL